MTPTLLPILRDAGVVDAGGHGLSVILEGIHRYVSGDKRELAEVPPPEPVGVKIGARAGAVSQDFLEAVDEELYGYCTQFLIQGEELDSERIREHMTSLALSTVVVGDASMVNVHVHALDPGPIISFAVSHGSLSQVKIESMDQQHREYSAARREEAAPVQATAGAATIAVVAVAWGEGLETVFGDLGAARVLPAGDTMNPSVRQILGAVESVPADNVIFLPNNGNIVPAARQAVELSNKSLKVVPSTTIPQGIAAMLVFNPELGPAENVSEMERMLPSVRTGEICRAVRTVELNGVSVRQGQVIGLLERELVVAGDEPHEVLVPLLRHAEVSDGDLVTLYWGEGVTQENAEIARELVESAFPGAEVEVIAGGQPHYQYIVSVE
jgi:DAK2 domain fusion protein YloV